MLVLSIAIAFLIKISVFGLLLVFGITAFFPQHHWLRTRSAAGIETPAAAD